MILKPRFKEENYFEEFKLSKYNDAVVNFDFKFILWFIENKIKLFKILKFLFLI